MRIVIDRLGQYFGIVLITVGLIAVFGRGNMFGWFDAALGLLLVLSFAFSEWTEWVIRESEYVSEVDDRLRDIEESLEREYRRLTDG